MSERKVFQKYIPPDLDPSKIAGRGRISQWRGVKLKPRQLDVRYMMPFTLKCSHCGEFMYTGKKFNSRIERIKGEEYLELPVYRIYGKCYACRGEFIFKTDPKNRDYLVIAGGVRTYSAKKDMEEMQTALEEQTKAEIGNDAMKELELKSSSAAKEMAQLEIIDELKRRSRKVHSIANINKAIQDARRKQIEEKEALDVPVELHEDDIAELRDFRRAKGFIINDKLEVEDEDNEEKIDLFDRELAPDLAISESDLEGESADAEEITEAGLEGNVTKRPSSLLGLNNQIIVKKPQKIMIEGIGLKKSTSPSLGCGLLSGYDTDSSSD